MSSPAVVPSSSSPSRSAAGLLQARSGKGPVILVVEDEPAPLRVFEAGLGARGYDLRLARTGRAALEVLNAEEPDVVIIDLGLPDIDGIELCRRVRVWSKCPIIVVTADGSVDRMVRALDEGADDYVTKPFSMPELLARIRVALRHRQLIVPDDNAIEVGSLRIDFVSHLVTIDGVEIDLQPRTFDLLGVLARNVGRIVTHRALARQLWGPEHTEPVLQPLRIVVSRLRKALGDGPGVPRVVTESHVGYRLVGPESDAPVQASSR